MLRLQRAGQRGVIELRVVTRAGHRADVHETFDAVGSQQGGEALDRQRRMTERENSAFRPMRGLRERMFAHGNRSPRMNCRVRRPSVSYKTAPRHPLI